jgi:DNA invertase Pin-like site-specific DNA recombinase
MAKARIPAIAYLRTSSAANVGAVKDSDMRQAIAGFAKRAGFDLVGEFYDAAVSDEPIEGRPGFKALLERVVGNGVRVVIVEDASRFARHLLTQEAGISLLVGLGVRVLTAAGDDLIDSDDEFRVAMRQIMGVFSAGEEAESRPGPQEGPRQGRGPAVAHRGAAGGRGGGQAAASGQPQKGERHSLRKIAAELAALGHLNVNGQPYGQEHDRRACPGASDWQVPDPR